MIPFLKIARRKLRFLWNLAHEKKKIMRKKTHIGGHQQWLLRLPRNVLPRRPPMALKKSTVPSSKSTFWTRKKWLLILRTSSTQERKSVASVAAHQQQQHQQQPLAVVASLSHSLSLCPLSPLSLHHISVRVVMFLVCLLLVSLSLSLTLVSCRLSLSTEEGSSRFFSVFGRETAQNCESTRY